MTTLFDSTRRWLPLLLFFGWGLVWVVSAEAQRRTGYRLTNNAVIVEDAAHWQRWSLPVHAVDLDPAGMVRPHHFRTHYNILDDRSTFTRPLAEVKRRRGETAILNVDSTETLDVRGEVIRDRKDVPLYSYFLRPGISRVGSNPADAANILDGDPTTFWEPDPDDPLENWWVEIDLGRVVPVDEFLLHFVDEELGDPFRQFRVLVAPDQDPVTQDSDKVDFVSVGGTNAPNESIRSFSMLLEQINSSLEWEGRLVETIRIIVTDSRRGRGHLLDDEAAWLDLSANERGDIVYYIRDLQGVEEPVERDIYDALDEARQGRLKYYKRERPRLADIEPLGFGDNISPGIIEGGGSIFLTGGNFAPGPAFDGDWSTNFLHLVYSPTIERGILTVDMGATFWLDAMRISSARPRTFIDGYIVRGSDGSRDVSGRIKWARISPRTREDNSLDRFEHLLDPYPEPQPLRFLEVSVVSFNPARRGGYNTGPNIAEYQLFARGYPADVTFTSDLIEFNEPRHFGGITWTADTPPGTNLQIRTRSGDLLGRVLRYFDKSGQEITYSAWKNLLGSFKGPADTTFVPTSGWSPWSRSYVDQGERVTSPGLRKYMQIRVTMTTTDRDVAAVIDGIRIDLLEPVAERVLAEITPTEVAVAGVLDTFDVYLQPNFISSPNSSLGFDEILLSMPSSNGLELLAIDVTKGTGRGQHFARDADDSYVDASGAMLTVLRQQADSIWVRLPEPVNILPDTTRVYHRITVEGEQVPVTDDDLPLSAPSWGLLAAEEQGDVLYFQRLSSGDLVEVDRADWLDLEEADQGPVRYFRVLRGDGGEYAFDDLGNSLDSGTYARLSASEKGRVIGPGPRLRIRFQSPVYLNGTTVDLAVRQTNGGLSTGAPWQAVEAGDAEPSIDANTLSLSVPLGGGIVEDLAITPNPFTPNGDGINDVTQIGLSIFRITSPRDLEISVYTLSGRRVWSDSRPVNTGNQSVPWNGFNAEGQLVPPGIYIVKAELNIDDDSASTILTRSIAVAY
ncbi:MAG TPA: hypothetical protein DIC52_18980 [Candidatus Latescibacteria bacterium]|nr:hypothetical protein [Candidatus Latescibacterota bacterium]|tara:strand:- start:5292 stop:8345 length:3054 start_codon:yes stop_codon:yes gene_type:complete